MKNLFIDANVIIDFFTTREPFSSDAAALFELAETNKVKIFISAVSLNIVYYIIRQQFGHKVTMTYLKEFCSLTTILDVTEKVIKNALASDNPDFEDAIQYCAAISNSKMEAIISRDKKGFRKSELPVFSAAEVFQLIQ